MKHHYPNHKNSLLNATSVSPVSDNKMTKINLCQLLLSICCLVYSHTSKAPLTCTLSDLIIPLCGISTQASSSCMISTGIPSFSLLQLEMN